MNRFSHISFHGLLLGSLLTLTAVPGCEQETETQLERLRPVQFCRSAYGFHRTS